ncbi:hypothetical protein [Robertkochia solimangrovi]|uniref:hypothetical protein n=1 Tax=Robertkochia solimangrovi TaxID=2213046 RepID=UPI0013A53F10|nr:hypothetical protein [Robertkochia solimangrovi]
MKSNNDVCCNGDTGDNGYNSNTGDNGDTGDTGNYDDNSDTGVNQDIGEKWLIGIQVSGNITPAYKQIIAFNLKPDAHCLHFTDNRL